MRCPLCVLGYREPHTKEDFDILNDADVRDRLHRINDMLNQQAPDLILPNDPRLGPQGKETPVSAALAFAVVMAIQNGEVDRFVDQIGLAAQFRSKQLRASPETLDTRLKPLTEDDEESSFN